MKAKLVLLLAAFFLITFSVFAQVQEESEPLIQSYMIHEFSDQMNLTEEQLSQILAADEVFEKAMNEVYSEEIAEEEYDYEANQKAFQTMQKEHSEKLKTIIGEKGIAQLQTLQEMQRVEQELQHMEYRKESYMRGVWDMVVLSEEQIEAIILAEDELNNSFDHSVQTDYNEAKEAIYQSILTEEQWAVYQAEINAERQADIDQTLEEMDLFIPAFEAVVAYFEEESFAKHQALRNKLETKISAPDKVSIDALRTEVDRLFQREFEKEMETRPAKLLTPEVDLRIERIGKAFTTMFEMHVIPVFLTIFNSGDTAEQISIEEVERLAKEYDKDIEALNEELTALVQADMKKEIEILKKIMPENEAKQMANQINMQFREDGLINDINKDDMNMLRNISFLLIPVKERSILDSDGMLGKESFRVYPSPSKGAHTLELDLLVEDNIIVELLNSNGQVIKVVHSSTLPEGKNQLSFDWSDLEGTLFYYRISGKSGVLSTQKFILSK